VLLAGGLCLSASQIAQARTAYVVNNSDGTLTPINTATSTPGTAIKLGGAPYGIAITPDGKTAYVVDEEGSVIPVNTATSTPGTAIKLGGHPYEIAITPDGRTAYIVDAEKNTLTPINLATNTPGAAIKVPGEPDALAITPDGKTAYVLGLAGTVTPVNLATGTAGAAITVGAEAIAIVITPDGKTVYATSGTLNAVTPINTATNTAGTPIKVGARPYSIAVTPDGKTVFTANDNENTVTPIDTATNTARPGIEVGNCPAAIAITPDGLTAFVANACPGTVTPISLVTSKPGAEIKVGSDPSMVAITPNQPPTAAFSATTVTLGQASGFNASASTDADGSIVSYAWAFGDGSTSSMTAPSTTHTYAASGTYTARLTLTDNEGCSTTFVFTGQTAFCNGSAVASVTSQVTVTPVPVKALPPLPPTVTNASQSHSVWRTGSHLATFARTRRPPIGTTFAFTLNESASVSLAFSQKGNGRKVKGRCVAQTRGNRHKRSCNRSLPRGTLSVTAHAGVNTVSFQGRISAARKLKPGRYTLTIVATNAAGQHSASKALSFTIVK
jgi:YVTN family beta-propeller protein